MNNFNENALLKILCSPSLDANVALAAAIAMAKNKKINWGYKDEGFVNKSLINAFLEKTLMSETPGYDIDWIEAAKSIGISGNNQILKSFSLSECASCFASNKEILQRCMWLFPNNSMAYEDLAAWFLKKGDAIEELKELMKSGINPNAKTYSGYPVWCSARNSENLQVINSGVTKINVNGKDVYGWSKRNDDITSQECLVWLLKFLKSEDNIGASVDMHWFAKSIQDSFTFTMPALLEGMGGSSYFLKTTDGRYWFEKMIADGSFNFPLNDDSDYSKKSFSEAIKDKGFSNALIRSILLKNFMRTADNYNYQPHLAKDSVLMLNYFLSEYGVEALETFVKTNIEEPNIENLGLLILPEVFERLDVKNAKKYSEWLKDIAGLALKIDCNSLYKGLYTKEWSVAKKTFHSISFFVDYKKMDEDNALQKLIMATIHNDLKTCSDMVQNALKSFEDVAVSEARLSDLTKMLGGDFSYKLVKYGKANDLSSFIDLIENKRLMAANGAKQHNVFVRKSI
jgi:hypothetical protein